MKCREESDMDLSNAERIKTRKVFKGTVRLGKPNVKPTVFVGEGAGIDGERIE